MYMFLTTIILILFCSIPQYVNGQARCLNPNRRNGVCLSLYDCPILQAVIKKIPLTDLDRQFLFQSQCVNGFGSFPHVCCSEDSRFTNNIPPTLRPPKPLLPSSPSSGIGNILPTPPKCGTAPTGTKIYSGFNTELDEFPWMALLEYELPNKQKILDCAGTLINQRYILTAAHCLAGKITERQKLITIRLGEYNTATDIDCIEQDCADPIVEVGFEEIIVHPQYSQTNKNNHHDIGLIRLNRDIKYTEFIKPVCLPSVVNLQRSLLGDNVVISGWGRTLTERKSAIKQKLMIPVTDDRKCQEKFSTKRVTLIESQLCAGGKYIEDSCDGDSGGPLMRQINNHWILEGIVSFGNQCGLEGWPGIYTRVSSYEDWIRQTIRP